METELNDFVIKSFFWSKWEKCGGQGYGLYRTKPATFLFSFVVHTLVLLGLGLAGSYLASHRKEIQRQVVAVVTDISPYVLPASNTKAGGGGGGGERDKLQASKGALPELSREQVTPPRRDRPQ